MTCGRSWVRSPSVPLSESFEASSPESDLTISFVRRSGGMADAQASGACYGNIVWVQVPSPASSFLEAHAEVSELADEQD